MELVEKLSEGETSSGKTVPHGIGVLEVKGG
jgi:hypothetical protein